MKQKVSLLFFDKGKTIIFATKMYYELNPYFDFIFTVVNSETEMFESINESNYDMILCDIEHLSDESFLKLKKLKRLKRNNFVIVYSVTFITNRAIKTGLKYGASCVHIKSLEPELLFPMYKEVLEGKIFEFEELSVMNKTRF
jgi:DNA-binding NarL/FixJ family response regulator